MGSAAHHIRRLRCRVLTDSPGQGFAIREPLTRLVGHSVLPAIESAFDAMGANDVYIEIDRLEIRVSLPSFSQLVERLPELVEQEIRHQLRDIVRAESAPARNKADPRGRRLSVEERYQEALVWYLERGSLPASFSGADAAAHLDGLRGALKAWLPRASAIWRQGGRSLAILHRLLQLAEESCWPDIAAAFASELSQPGQPLLTRVVSEIAALPDDCCPRLTRIEAAAATIAGTLEPRAGELRKKLWYLVDGIGKATGGDSGAAKALEVIRGLVAELASETWFDERPVVAPEEVLAEPVRPITASKKAERSGWEHAIPVSCAGLILLHPFLARFFEATRILNPATRQPHAGSESRAAALLYLLATGREEAPEFELDFCKILLGLSQDTELLVSAGLLSPDDEAEAEALLNSVIQHWSALKSSSIDALRTTFLQRRGLLEERDASWHLRIESSPFDVLLTQLPWELSLVKTSWLPRPIYTEW